MSQSNPNTPVLPSDVLSKPRMRISDRQQDRQIVPSQAPESAKSNPRIAAETRSCHPDMAGYDLKSRTACPCRRASHRHSTNPVSLPRSRRRSLPARRSVSLVARSASSWLARSFQTSDKRSLIGFGPTSFYACRGACRRSQDDRREVGRILL